MKVVIKDLDELLERAKQKEAKKIAVAVAQDDDVLAAIKAAKEAGIADAVLVGDEDKITSIAKDLAMDLSDYEVIHEPNEKLAAKKAVELVSSGKAGAVMKGLLGTAGILRAVLDKEKGLRKGKLLSHAAVAKIPGREGLVVLTDPAMNIAPDLMQKVEIIKNAMEVTAALGIEKPKVAALAAIEKVNPDMPATMDAAVLAKMADRGQIKNAIIDGPLALDNAISLEAANDKGIKSAVAGVADILLAPDIEVGNVLYKSLVYFAGLDIAGVLLGAKAPVILTSRADTARTKLLSIALATVMEKE